MKTLTFLLCILIATSLCAQDVSKENLAALQDEELLELFNQVFTDSIKAEKVARTYLNRARAQEDTIKMARGYDRLARIFHLKKNILFADSLIQLTEHLNHKTYPTMGYIIKGALYCNNYEFDKCTSNLLKAYEYSVKNKNVFFQLFIRRNIIETKIIWGDPREGLKLSKLYYDFLNSIDYESAYNEYVRPSIKSIPGEYLESLRKDKLIAKDLITVSYIYTQKFDSARYNVKEVLTECRKSGDFDNYYKYLARAGEIEYYLKNYDLSIDKLEESLSNSKFKSENSIMNDYLYIGLSYNKLGQESKGFEYLKKADSLYELTKEILPVQTELFIELYNFYKKKNDFKKQIVYLNKLIYTDSIFRNNLRYIDSRIKNNLETPELLREKEELIARLEKKQRTTKSMSYWYLLVAILSLTAFLFYYGRQRTYKQRYENLIAKQTKPKTDITSQDVVTSISTSIISDILTSLEQFESKQEYLSQNISLTKLAKTFGTNSNYLSKVINLKMEKSFPQYINDLRVDYAAEELRTNRQFRRFTIKAIAEDCGFRSAESFSKAFYKSHGIYPSYYIKKLNKKNEGL